MSPSNADLLAQVIEYLSKKGYSRTESMLRIESANQDAEGRPITTKVEESGGVKYLRAFGLSSLVISFLNVMLKQSQTSCNDGLMKA